MFNLVVSFSLFFGGGENTGSLDINPTFYIDVPISHATELTGGGEFWSITLPHLIIIDEAALPDSERERILYEEGLHAEQWSALGPWYAVGYAATLGRAFEPYDPVAFWMTGQMPDELDWDRMWVPDHKLAQRCPLLRFDSVGIHVLPCWAKWKE